MTTLAMAMATEPPAIANSTYATVNAPLSNVCLPRELIGLLSSPIVIRSLSVSSNGLGIMTESFPVPKLAPIAILLQNSQVAQRKGMTPIMNTIIVVSGLSCSICKLSICKLSTTSTSDACCIGSTAIK